MIAPEEKIVRFRDFWSRANDDRPLIALTGSYYPRETLESLQVKAGPLRPEEVDVAHFVDCCDRQYEQWADCLGDGFWSATPLWGVPWGQAILGQEVVVGEQSIWNAHAKLDWDEIQRLCDFRESPWFRLLLEMAERMAVKSGGRYPLSTLITPGIVVILAEMRGMADLVYDMIDEPERVERAMSQITEALLEILDAYFERIPTWAGGYGSHTRGLWAPGRLIEYDEDSNYLLNAAMQKQFVMPSHGRVAEAVEFAYCHLHSTQLHTLDNLLADDRIQYYELCPDVGYDLTEIIAVLRKILERGRCVITHAFFQVEEVKEMIDSLPPQGLYIGVRAESADQARDLQEQIMAERGWC